MPRSKKGSTRSKTVYKLKFPDTKIVVGPSAPPMIPIAEASFIDSKRLLMTEEYLIVPVTIKDKTRTAPIMLLINNCFRFIYLIVKLML